MRKMYSENQIIEVIIRAIESGLIPIGSDVVSYEGTSLLATDVVFEDWTLHRAIKDGNVLWIVLSGNIKNNSASSITPLEIFTITLPSDISSKIYRRDGSTCNNAYTSNEFVLSMRGVQNSADKQFDLDSPSANTLILSLSGGSAIASGSYANFQIRIPLFLEIGE